MRTSGGHPSIGMLFLPTGLADGLTVVGICVMVYAVVAVAHRTSSPVDHNGQVEMTEEVKAVYAQLARLNRYQVEAIRKLLLTGGMTGEHFYLAVEKFGFPIHSAAAQEQIFETFDRINEVTSLLEVEPHSKVWRVRLDVRDRVTRLLPKTPAIF